MCRHENLVRITGQGREGTVAVVLTAGAVATSIGAILALWPDPDEPPAELNAEFSDIEVEPSALGAFKRRDTELEGSAAGSVSSSHLAALTVGEQAATSRKGHHD